MCSAPERARCTSASRLVSQPIAAVMLTLLVVTLIGRVTAGHMWIGALVAGVAELARVVRWSAWLVKQGIWRPSPPTAAKD